MTEVNEQDLSVNPHLQLLEGLVNEKITALIESGTPEDKEKAYKYHEMFNHFGMIVEITNVAVDTARGLKLLSSIAI